MPRVLRAFFLLFLFVFVKKFLCFGVMDIAVLISKLLGWTILAGAVGLKIPQILRIVKAGSVEGISSSMYYTEIISYTISVSYNYVILNAPFSTYGDLWALLIQNYIVVSLMLHFKPNSKDRKFAPFAIPGYAAFAAALLSGQVDSFTGFPVLQQLMRCVIFLTIYSRVPQIKQNFDNQSTGELSLTLFLLSSVGCLARCYTTYMEAFDYTTLTGYVLGFVLNGIVAFQILYYKKKSNKKKD